MHIIFVVPINDNAMYGQCEANPLDRLFMVGLLKEDGMARAIAAAQRPLEFPALGA